MNRMRNALNDLSKLKKSLETIRPRESKGLTEVTLQLRQKMLAFPGILLS